MYSFHQWLRRSIAAPLVGVGLILFVRFYATTITILILEQKKQNNLVRQFANITLQTTTTHQLEFLNHLAAIATDDIGAQAMVLCEDADHVSWSYPYVVHDCSLKTPLGYRILESSIFPREPYPRILVSAPYFPNYSVLYPVIVATVFILFGGMFLLFHIRKTISLEIYKPLQEIGRDSKRFQIDEFDKIHTDLCALRQLERQQATDAAVGRMSREIAHDIRGPLSSLQAAIRVFVGKKNDQCEFTDMLNLIQLSVVRLTGIANGLLNNVASDLHPKVIFSLHKVLDELVGEYGSRESGGGAQFVKRYYMQFIELYGNRVRLQRAFENILKNAVEAMGDKGTVTMCTKVEGGHVVVSISDTGPGMSEEKLQRVLAGGHTEGKRDGHGIGMTVVRETVAEFGGKVAGESTLGEGSTFSISLPLPEASMLQKAPRELDAMKECVIRVKGNSPIVVVDDEPNMREQWRMMLSAEGCDVLPCSSYEDLLRHNISEQTSCTAIVDYHFNNSDQDGAAVIAYLKERGFVYLTLCTAEYWKPSVQKLAQEFDVQLCSKPLPEIIVKRERPSDAMDSAGCGRRNVLVLDDDEGIRLAWKVQRNTLGIGQLSVFSSMEECEAARINYADYNYAFVDKCIEHSSWDLMRTVKHLKQAGVEKVIIASGYSQLDIEADPAFQFADGVASEKIPESLDQMRW